MPRVAEPVHKPTPPEHVKPIADLSRRYRLGKLAGEFHTRAQAAHDHVFSLEAQVAGEKRTGRMYGNFATKPESTASACTGIGRMRRSASAMSIFTGRK